MQNMRPKVGIGVLIFNSSRQILLGKRLSKHGDGYYGPPGGHLEHGEKFDGCAARETREEAGIVVDEFTYAGTTNDIFPDGKHYISIFMAASMPKNQVVKNCEPEKCESWGWYSLSDLPKPLFQPLQDWVDGKAFGRPSLDEILPRAGVQEVSTFQKLPT